MGAIRFLWNAASGHRLMPWRSQYLRWRLETYSGIPAESITAGIMFRFVWRERRQLLRFLLWTGELERRLPKG